MGRAIDRNQIDELYSLYRFDKLHEDEFGIVYHHESGYFNNVEIFEIEQNACSNVNLQKQYEAAGYSVKKVYYESYSDAHHALFKGFFNVKQAKSRLKRDYTEYCAAQSRHLGDKENEFVSYEYIKGTFYIDGELNERDDLIETIVNEINVSNSKLIILEAAAGYGKTCTTYEALDKLLDIDSEDCKVPLLAELSKNRKATIFRYVLQHEINRSFTDLKYEAVMHEIKLGNIPVIIDGFDELLSKNQDEEGFVSDYQNDEAQTMLDTIAQIFDDESKAKVLLTSRKSSIFAGERFDRWVESRLSTCEILRIQLNEPTIKQWIGPDKVSLLSEKGISLEYVPSPVLLAFIRGRSIDELSHKYSSTEDILDSYFELLLTRERERNQILLPWREQYQIMISLAALLIMYDISAGDASDLRALFSLILAERMSEYLEEYESVSEVSTEIRPQDESEFIDKFVRHALLDRISFSSNKIGFINDFVFGVMIGEAVLQDKIKIENMLSEKYIDICTTAFSVRGQESRERLFERLDMAIGCLNAQQQLNVDLILLNRLSQDYEDCAFEFVVFKQGMDLTTFSFQRCTFHSCVFTRCQIPTSLFLSCHFYDCKFYDIHVIQNTTDDRCISFFGKSEGYSSLAAAGLCNDTYEAVNVDYKRKVVEQFVKPGYNKAELNKLRTTLYRGFADAERKHVDVAIEELCKIDLLIPMSRVVKLNVKKMHEIHEIIGR